MEWALWWDGNEQRLVKIKANFSAITHSTVQLNIFITMEILNLNHHKSIFNNDLQLFKMLQIFYNGPEDLATRLERFKNHKNVLKANRMLLSIFKNILEPLKIPKKCYEI